MSERLVVVRYDMDQDMHADVVTLDVSRDPYRVVEALQSLPSGEFIDASDRWSGRRIDERLETALRAYLDRSVAVGAETELQVMVDDQPVIVSVIE